MMRWIILEAKDEFNRLKTQSFYPDHSSYSIDNISSNIHNYDFQ